MHPIGRNERYLAWLQSRPWRPNAALLGIYGVLFFLAVTQIEFVQCKCNFHPGIIEETFHRNYAVILVLFLGMHVVLSKRMTTRPRQIIAVCVFSLFGAAIVPIATESARQKAPKFGQASEMNNVIF